MVSKGKFVIDMDSTERVLTRPASDGFATSEELAMLQSVLEEACKARKIKRPSADAEALAQFLLDMFRIGARDQGSLRRLLPWENIR